MEDTSRDLNLYIIDDSDFSRNTISSMLQEAGYHVVGDSSTPTEAIADFNEKDIDIAIIDVVLPEASGIDLCERLTKKIHHLKVIMISSLKQENIVVSAISAGASDFLQKPIRPDILIESIKKIQRDFNRR